MVDEISRGTQRARRANVTDNASTDRTKQQEKTSVPYAYAHAGHHDTVQSFSMDSFSYFFFITLTAQIDGQVSDRNGNTQRAAISG